MAVVAYPDFIDDIIDFTFDIENHKKICGNEKCLYNSARIWRDEDYNACQKILNLDLLTDEPVIVEMHASHYGPSKLAEYGKFIIKNLDSQAKHLDDNDYKMIYFYTYFFTDLMYYNKLANIGLTKEEFKECGLNLLEFNKVRRDCVDDMAMPLYSDNYNDKLHEIDYYNKKLNKNYGIYLKVILNNCHLPQ